jgi:membrane-associated phospholipid phosphatase
MLLLAIIGGFLLTQIKTGDSVFYFSDNRTPEGDFFFFWVTKVGELVTYLVLLIYFLFVRYRYSLLIAVTGIVTMIISFSSKLFFSHDRPILFFEKLGNLENINLIEGVYNVTGQTSFPSGHTMSGFALFGIFTFIVGRKNLIGTICFITALLIGVSRIYLVQHFFKDIYLGALMGSIIALCIYWFQSRYPIDENNLLDRRINYKKRV